MPVFATNTMILDSRLILSGPATRLESDMFRHMSIAFFSTKHQVVVVHLLPRE